MSDVIDLNQARLERSPHKAGQAICLGCKATWVAVCPVGTEVLECPECRCHKGVMAGLCLPPAGTPSMHCECGGDLFVVLQGFKAHCPGCGRLREIDQ